MYALLYEDTNELVAIFESRHTAVTCAQFLSQEKERTIIAVYNDQSGGTTHVVTFSNGQEIGASPHPSAELGPEARPH